MGEDEVKDKNSPEEKEKKKKDAKAPEQPKEEDVDAYISQFVSKISKKTPGDTPKPPEEKKPPEKEKSPSPQPSPPGGEGVKEEPKKEVSSLFKKKKEGEEEGPSLDSRQKHSGMTGEESPSPQPPSSPLGTGSPPGGEGVKDEKKKERKQSKVSDRLESFKVKLISLISPKTAISRGGLVGLDIGSSSIKVVHTKRKQDRAEIVGYHIEQLPEEIEMGKKNVILREKLKDFKRDGIISAPAVCCFTDPNLSIELLKLPVMPTEELHTAVEWAMKEQFSIDLEESVLDFSVLGKSEDEGERNLQVLAVTTDKRLVTEYLGMISDAGIDVIAVEPTPLAFFEALQADVPWEPGEVVGLMDIGAKVTNFNIIVANSVHFSRTLSISGDSFTQSIADYCMMDAKTANGLKKDVGMSRMVLEEDRRVKEEEQDDRVKIAHALGLCLEQFMTELDRSFKYFSLELTGSAIRSMNRILLGGGSGMLKNLGDFLSYRLKVPVGVVNPLRGLAIDENKVNKDEIMKVSPQLCAAIGLALRK